MNATAPDLRPDETRVWAALREIPDPEIPTLGIVDLGIVRHVRAAALGFEIGLTPTYSGCPATDVIRQLVDEAMAARGIRARVTMVVKPAWTTDGISEQGRRKLAESGIVPPARLSGAGRSASALNDDPVDCPHCRSACTTRVSEFGSTPCKALYRCHDCLEPFERFKCL